ncbi:bifunctional 2-polyprenyl-6-hydroxyphenol methylase/3-demethylubiquinol 3-O-methyltransferase UbiG [Nocardioides sp. zg-1228]|uniref:class I SAM-dependent methyltransferase n=1 Tax=Nocardioides sp. zg-1228 TaxID=2763008 RepID=UPI0016423D47|nr:class I SAM-dependent methyltransferase [Nocardioides sp. zg-1228]MBC2934319.1 class I SAM-dependent methyltransferase [Nocardioides sp. zg-1228]QSF59098.1 class I SAM-dependent methyltransferase [Nocardioides sp. zg-1228]
MAEALWTGVAQAYARSFAGLCAGTIPALLDGLPRGARLLDVGCGTGALVGAARQAGHDAVGVEPDLEMAGLAAAALGREHVLVGGLPELPMADDGYEVVTAAFVLNHVEDPRAGARELARVAAPGAVVRATIWGATPPPQAVMWGGLLDAAGARRVASPRLAPERDFERSADGLAGILAEAGLTVTAAGARSWTWRVAADDLWCGLTTVGNFGVAWRAQPEAVRARLRSAYDALGPHHAFDVECVLVEARLPRS